MFAAVLQFAGPVLFPEPKFTYCTHKYREVSGFSIEAPFRVPDQMLQLFNLMAFPRDTPRLAASGYFRIDVKLQNERSSSYSIEFSEDSRILVTLGEKNLLFQALISVSELVTSVPNDEPDLNRYAVFICNLSFEFSFVNRIFMLDVSSHYFTDALLEKLLLGLACLGYNEVILQTKPYFAFYFVSSAEGSQHRNDLPRLAQYAAPLGISINSGYFLVLEQNCSLNMQYYRREFAALKAANAEKVYLDISLVESVEQCSSSVWRAEIGRLVSLAERLDLAAITVRSRRNSVHEEKEGFLRTSVQKMDYLSSLRFSYSADNHLLYWNIWQHFLNEITRLFSAEHYYIVSLDCEEINHEYLIQRAFVKQLPILQAERHSALQVTLENIAAYEAIYCKLWALGVVSQSLNPHNMCYGIRY